MTWYVVSRPQSFILSVLFAGGLTACGDETLAPPRTEGRLWVSVDMSGFLPSRTVQVMVDDTLTFVVQGLDNEYSDHVSGNMTLATGVHRVTVTGLDPNCAVPEPQQITIRGYSPNSLSFEVQCQSDPALTGRGMAWIEDQGDAWGNSLQLVLMSPDGSELAPESGMNTADLAWSRQGDEIAILGAASKVRFLNPQTGSELRNEISSDHGAALAWLPGREALSVLELAQSECRIRVIAAPWTEDAVYFIPCGAALGGLEAEGDIAWSPDERYVAVIARGDAGLRLVKSESGIVVNRALPWQQCAPLAVAWAPDGATLFVLVSCSRGFGPNRLVLSRHDPEAGTWAEVAGWDSETHSGSVATLDIIDAGRLSVGPVGGRVYMVPLGAPGESRPLMTRSAWRLSRRPG